MSAWPAGEIRPLGLDQIGEAYRRYRLAAPEAEAAMARSLRRYGQMSPIVVCRVRADKLHEWYHAGRGPRSAGAHPPKGWHGRVRRDGRRHVF